MDIHWYPGHMARAMRELEQSIKAVDLIMYVLDARIPGSCINPDFEELIAGKPVLYVLCKQDIADPKMTDKWVRALSVNGREACAVNAAESRAFKSIMAKVKELSLKKAELWKRKGLNYCPKAIIIGIPNCGKSTLINNICQKARTKTGDKPGVTRGKQWVRLEYIELLDMPGLLPHKFDNKVAAMHLAFAGSIKDEITEHAELAAELIVCLNKIDINILTARYNAGINSVNDVARARGYVQRGGELDTDRAALTVLDDFRKTRLGRITLEAPDDV